MIDYDNPPYYEDGKTPIPMENTIIGQYKVGCSISFTPSSFVFRCSYVDENEKSELVIKFIKMRKTMVEQIKDEIDIMSSLESKYTLKLLDFFRYEEYICTITPYAKHGSLHSILKSGPIPQEIACLMFHQMLLSVQCLHSKNIWHRDIKPGNFLLFQITPENPLIVLSDFGLAHRFLEDDLCLDFVGTQKFIVFEI